jgi:hypothetical protein
MPTRFWAVYYGPVLCSRYDKTDIPAIFTKEDSACLFAAHMNTINRGYEVHTIVIKKVMPRVRPIK